MDVGGVLRKKAKYICGIRAGDRFWTTWMLREVLGDVAFCALQYDMTTRAFASQDQREALQALFFGEPSPQQMPRPLTRNGEGVAWIVPAFLCMFEAAMFPGDQMKHQRRLKLLKASCAVRVFGDRPDIVAELSGLLQRLYERPLKEIGTEARVVMGEQIYTVIASFFPGAPPLRGVQPSTKFLPVMEPVGPMTCPGRMNDLAREYTARVLSAPTRA